MALVFAMEGFQALFVFLIAFGISVFTKINLNEELDRRNVFLKILALLLMIGGIALLNL